MKSDPDNHHRRSIRLPDYDYAQDGAYFVTMCAHRHLSLFGEVAGDEVMLNTLGCIAWDEWFKTGEQRPYVVLDEFVVMPNHVHAIVIINRGYVVGAQRAAPLQTPTVRGATPNNVKPGSLSAIVWSYKSATTRQINHTRQTLGAPVWQRGYYEHVIREYILDNPVRWAEDEYYCESQNRAL